MVLLNAKPMTAKLILSLNGTVLDEFLLDKVRITIGRRSVSDIHLDHLAISGEHALILKVDHDFYVEDVGSTNGTRVNSMRVKKHLLRHDDLIEFGMYQLKYLNEDAIGSEQEVGCNLTEVKLHAASKITSSTPMDDTQNVVNSLMIARIKVLNGSNSGRVLTLDKALTTLGKHGLQVAVITKRPNGYFITHIEGRESPIVNGHPVGAQAFALNHNDSIKLAGVEMEFYLE